MKVFPLLIELFIKKVRDSNICSSTLEKNFAKTRTDCKNSEQNT